MATRIEAGKLDAMSKKELVDLIQSVASLDLLQTNSLSGNPANVAKRANKVPDADRSSDHDGKAQGAVVRRREYGTSWIKTNKLHAPSM